MFHDQWAAELNGRLGLIRDFGVVGAAVLFVDTEKPISAKYDNLYVVGSGPPPRSFEDRLRGTASSSSDETSILQQYIMSRMA